MSNFDKNRVLVLYKLLVQYTDETHQISMREILSLMESQGHVCSEDSILRYIKQLKNELGVDIISNRGRNARYFIGNRLFEKEEVKLLIDSINASNFIEKTIATKMVGKLKSTMSKYDADDLERSVLGISNTKAENKKILYNVNVIQEALKNNLQISFDNMVWNKDKKLEKRNSHKNTLNPWALIWANDRYYLYGYDTYEYQGEIKERHYRVDKLDNIELINEPRYGEERFSSFNANTYVSRRMGMFRGEEHVITVRIPYHLIGSFIDQFGKEILINEDEDKLLVTFKAAPTKILFGWLIGLQGVEVIKPESVRTQIMDLLQFNIKMYTEKN